MSNQDWESKRGEARDLYKKHLEAESIKRDEIRWRQTLAEKKWKDEVTENGPFSKLKNILIQGQPS